MRFTDEQLDLINIDQSLPENKFIFCSALAGTGKSTSIVAKLMSILDNTNVNSLKPYEICFFSFSKVASKEIKNKLKDKIDYNKHSDQIYVSTIHSWAYRMLRENPDLFCRISEIRDDSFEKYLITVFLEEDDAKLKDMKVKDILTKFTYIKNYIVEDVDKYLDEPDYFDIWEEIRQYKMENEVWTFDDLIYECYWMLKKNPQVLDRYSRNIRYLFCDECQDVNVSNIKLLDLFIENNPVIKTICVGDINQTLYTFRGADYQVLIEFFDKYEAKVLGLSETFRFGSRLCALSNKIIEKIPIPDKYKLETVTNQGETKITTLFKSSDVYVSDIVDVIEDKLKLGEKPEDMYIMYRQNKLSIQFERELNRRRIPYVIRNGGSFLSRPEIKLLISTIRFFQNVNQSDLLLLASSMKVGIDVKTIKNVFSEMGKTKKKMDAIEFINEVVTKKVYGVGEYRKQGFLKLKDYFVEIKSLYEENPLNFFEQLADSININSMKFMEDEVNKEGVNNRRERWEYIRTLDNMKADGTSSDIFDFINYVQVQFSGDKSEDENDEGKVRLQTVHGSKGETHLYSFVVLDKFFSFSAVDGDEEYVSDLYVLYVAATRAKKEVYFACEDLHRMSWLFDGEEDITKEDASVVNAIEPQKNIHNLFEEDIFYNNYSSGKTKVRLSYTKMMKETDKAMLFEIDYLDTPVWLPKSHIGYDGQYVYLSRWIAEQKGI